MIQMSLFQIVFSPTQLGMDTGNVDMAKTMAEVFSIGDINKDEKLSKVEFVQVRIIKPIWTPLNPSEPIW